MSRPEGLFAGPAPGHVIDRARLRHNPRVVAWPAGDPAAPGTLTVRIEDSSAEDVQALAADTGTRADRRGSGLIAIGDSRGVLVRGEDAAFAQLVATERVEGPTRALAILLAETVERFRARAFRLPLPNAGAALDLGPPARLMGVLNVTPDSFSDGGRFADPERAVEHGLELAAAGAAVIDVGGESTRPGADAVDEREEIRRVVPVLRELSRRVELPLSIDTRKHRVAEAAIEAGATIVNDVSGLAYDPLLAEVAARARTPVVLMHMRGTPRTMQEQLDYEDLLGEIARELREGIARAVAAGVEEGAIIVDPGIGFAKGLEQNLEILRRLAELRSLGRPVLVGVSRKAFIGTLTGRPPQDRVLGTAAAVTAAILGGAALVRVHDVAEMRDAAVVAAAIARGDDR